MKCLSLMNITPEQKKITTTTTELLKNLKISRTIRSVKLIVSKMTLIT